MTEKAVLHYKQGLGNCAQSVAAAWAAVSGLDTASAADSFADCGRGQAPAGLCGALHAASTLAAPEAKPVVVDAFREKTGGHVTCSDIRKARALPCVECVRLAARLLKEAANR